MTLKTAIAYAQTLMSTIPGIRGAPPFPPEGINIFPFAVAYPSSGIVSFGAGGGSKALHTIAIEIHVARMDLPRDVEAVIDFAESVPQILQSNPTLGGAISTFGDIRYTFGPLGWQGVTTMGYRFMVENVKIEEAL